MTSSELYAAYGAPAIVVLFGYALLWWTRLSPRLVSKIREYRSGSQWHQHHVADR